MATSCEKSVLVIEDNDSVRGLLMRIVQKAGYQAVPAINGAEAVDLLNTNKFSLITLDGLLPDTNATNLLIKMAEQGVTTPVVVVSGTPDMLQVQSALVKATVSKPFRVDELLNVVGQYAA